MHTYRMATPRRITRRRRLIGRLVFLALVAAAIAWLPAQLCLAVALLLAIPVYTR